MAGRPPVEGGNATNQETYQNLAAETSQLVKTRNTGILGPLLKLTGHGFPPMDTTWKERLRHIGTDIRSFIPIPNDQMPAEMEWLRAGLLKGMNTPDYEGVPIGQRMMSLLLIDKTDYIPTGLDVNKRMIMNRIHVIEEYFAMSLITGEPAAMAHFFNFLGIFRAFEKPSELVTSYLNNILSIVGRIMGNTEELETLLTQVDLGVGTSDTLRMLPFSNIAGEAYKGYHKAFLYRLVEEHVLAILEGLPKHVAEIDETYRRLFDEETFSVIGDSIVPIETHIEKYRNVGTGVNVFIDPDSYLPPSTEQIEQALDNLTAVTTNINLGGSEELPTEYEAYITEGMRLRDIWGVNRVHIVGKHPTPILEDSPLLLHIAMERASGQPPFYAYYNIRSKQLFMLSPDLANLGAFAEMHLHLYALITDMRNLERSGISVHEGRDEQEPFQGTKLKIPMKRTYVVSHQGIHPGSPPEPTGMVNVGPQQKTLPYGSRYTLALAQLEDANARSDDRAKQEAQANVDSLARRLPIANPLTLERYRQKAIVLGLDPDSITIRAGRVIAAPRREYDMPIFTLNPQGRRTVQVIPGFQSHSLRMNEIFATGGFTGEAIQQENNQPDRQTLGRLRRLLERLRGR